MSEGSPKKIPHVFKETTAFFGVNIASLDEEYLYKCLTGNALGIMAVHLG